jgi:hypothetical protein
VSEPLVVAPAASPGTWKLWSEGFEGFNVPSAESKTATSKAEASLFPEFASV